jgi:hypothetical protein
VKGKSLGGQTLCWGKREGGNTLAQVGATIRRRGGKDSKDQDGYAQTRSKRRWEDGRKYSGPIFFRRPEGTEKIR